MQVAHEHKVPLIVDNTFGMGGMRASDRPRLDGITSDGCICQGI